MPGFERDKATENVDHIHQFRGVLGEPAIGLYIPERGRRTSVTYDRSGSVVAPVAEPLDKHLLT